MSWVLIRLEDAVTYSRILNGERLTAFGDMCQLAASPDMTIGAVT